MVTAAAPAPAIACSPVPADFPPACFRRERKNIHAHFMVVKEFLRLVQVRLDRDWQKAPRCSRPGNCGNGSNRFSPKRSNLRNQAPIPAAWARSFPRRPMALAAYGSPRSSALSPDSRRSARLETRNAAGLPVVVIVEPAHPAIVVHRHIQMHLVARLSKIPRVCVRMNGFRNLAGAVPDSAPPENRAAGAPRDSCWPPVRATPDTPAVKSPCPIVLFTCAIEWHIMQPSPPALPACLPSSRIGRVEHAAEEQRRIVAARAPFRRLTPCTSCMYSMLLRYH